MSEGAIAPGDGRRNGPRIGRRPYHQTGVHTLKRRLRVRGLAALDQRTEQAKALRYWQAELVRDLGGAQTLTAQQATILELAVRVRVLLDQLDAWLLEQPNLVNKRSRTALPVVTQRGQLSDQLVRYLALLGLERKVPSKPALASYVADRYGKGKGAATESGTTTQRDTAGAAPGPASEAPRPAGDSDISPPVPGPTRLTRSMRGGRAGTVAKPARMPIRNPAPPQPLDDAAKAVAKDQICDGSQLATEAP